MVLCLWWTEESRTSPSGKCPSLPRVPFLWYVEDPPSQVVKDQISPACLRELDCPRELCLRPQHCCLVGTWPPMPRATPGWAVTKVRVYGSRGSGKRRFLLFVLYQQRPGMFQLLSLSFYMFSSNLASVPQRLCLQGPFGGLMLCRIQLLNTDNSGVQLLPETSWAHQRCLQMTEALEEWLGCCFLSSKEASRSFKPAPQGHWALIPGDKPASRKTSSPDCHSCLWTVGASAWHLPNSMKLPCNCFQNKTMSQDDLLEWKWLATFNLQIFLLTKKNFQIPSPQGHCCIFMRRKLTGKNETTVLALLTSGWWDSNGWFPFFIFCNVFQISTMNMYYFHNQNHRSC